MYLKAMKLTFVLLLLTPALPAFAADTPKPCTMAAEDAAWLQSAVTTWNKGSELLGRKVSEFPYAVVFDAECAWFLNPPSDSDLGTEVRYFKPNCTWGPGSANEENTPRGPWEPELVFEGKVVPVRELRHNNKIPLPSGQTISADPLAFTGITKAKTSFFVMALPSQWKKHPGVMPGEDIGAFARGVFAHEITHTIHLPAIARKFEKIGERYKMEEINMNDDRIQEIFVKDPDYVAAYEAEEKLYWEAGRTKDDAKARELIRQALKMAKARREKFLTGEYEYFREADELFLNMEGVACWVAYSVGAEAGDPEEHVGGFWSQRQGLAMFLLIDRFAPEWKKTVFSEEVPNPYQVLAEAVK